MKRFAGIIVNKNREDKGNLDTPVASKYRLIDFPLSNMVNAGAKNIGIVAGNNSNILSDHIGSGRDWGLQRIPGGLSFLEAERMTLGKQNASNDLRDLLKNIDFILNTKEEYLLLSGGNFVANIDFQKIFTERCLDECDFLILALENKQEVSDVNEVIFNEKGDFELLRYVEGPARPQYLFMESLFVRKDILLGMLRTASRSGIYCMNELLYKLRRDINIKVLLYDDICFYIDSPKRYFDANMAFLDQKIWTSIFNNGYRQIFTKNSDHPPSIYGSQALVQNSLITSGDHIRGQVKNSVVFRNVKIDRDSLIENCIIGENSIIEKGVHMKNVILAANCRIGKNSSLLGSPDEPMVIS